MAAPRQNTNGQKWTENTVLTYLSKLEKAASKPGNLFIGQQLKKLRLYRDIWSYWKRKFQNNEDLTEQMELIEDLFEVNLFNAGMRGEIPVQIAILSLRNAHGWRNNPKEETQDTGIVLPFVPREQHQSDIVKEKDINRAHSA